MTIREQEVTEEWLDSLEVNKEEFTKEDYEAIGIDTDDHPGLLDHKKP
jgi:hypothetical protein